MSTGLPSTRLRASGRWVVGLSIAAGLALLAIGTRFLLVPHQAARFFGLVATSGPIDLHRVIGVRDLWLALLLVGLAGLREWRALALCLALGTLVCFADAAIVLSAGGPVAAVAFHVTSGVYMAANAWAAWRECRPA